MTALGGLFGGLAMVALVFAVIVLVILAILMPYYVYKIAQHARETDEQIKKTNTLLRQLLISYGQDPQA
jgi:uncharacterized membrane protein